MPRSGQRLGRLTRRGLSGLPPRAAVCLLSAALGGTFVVSPFDEPRALNYLLLLLATCLLIVARLFRRPCDNGPSAGPVSLLLGLFYLYVLGTMLAQNGLALIGLAHSGFAEAADAGRLAKAVMFCLVGLCAYQAARLLEVEELLTTLFWSLLAIGLVSVVLAIFLPEFGRVDFVRGEAWSGLYGQKNAFGRQMALLGLVSVLMLVQEDTGRRRWPSAGLMLAMGGIAMSLSRTAALVFAIGTLVILITALLPRMVWSLLLAGSTAVAVLVELRLLAAPALFAIVPGGLVVADYPVDLTGRLPVWQFGWWLFLQEPIWGSGFDAVWSYTGGASIYLALGWHVTDSHNGYLDLLVQTGIVGALLYGTALMVVMARVFRLTLSRRPKTLEQALIVLFPILFCLINVSSSHIMECLSLWTFLGLLMCFLSDRQNTVVGGKCRHAQVQRHNPLSQPTRPPVAGRGVGRGAEPLRL